MVGSETDLEPPVLKKKKTKVKFDEGAVFLAACSSGDTDEVLRLLERGADINYANVDGLTALHQVSFLSISLPLLFSFSLFLYVSLCVFSALHLSLDPLLPGVQGEHC
ncbi:Protein phosphatase 1 regulatory subunit 12A [Bagarius yarrelli]|uniref:Protein phosphatase 1 regulatory subunit 12A n=1 Tax=Bagarius yarrelli TaxID=175774 RepID=A0A556VXJ8_BAGYA|nr:Protein phosphatase 1 regulatory subunit 12A [Bagarius yarrelli]